MEEQIRGEIRLGRYELVKVPSQFELGIQTPKGEVMTSQEALVECLNILSDLKKALTG